MEHETNGGKRALAHLGLMLALLFQPILCLGGEESARGEDEFFALRDFGTTISGETFAPIEGETGSAPAAAATAPATSTQFSGSLPRPVSIRVPGSPTDGGSSGGQLFTLMGVSMFAASAGDLLTTEMGLSRAGITEMNPVQSNRWARVGTHVAVPAFLWWITDRANDQGKTKLAWFMRVGFSVAYSYITLRNAQTIRSVR